MKIKRLLLLAVMPMMCLVVNAQEKSCSKDFTPQKDDFILAATVIKKIPNLMWYTKVRVGMAYAQNQVKYNEYEIMDKSVGETWNLRGLSLWV